jgi:hypothetical protein
MSARVGHPCDLSEEQKKQKEIMLQNPEIPLKDMCDFCGETKAVRTFKMQDGNKARLCQQCYDEELRSRGKNVKK